MHEIIPPITALPVTKAEELSLPGKDDSSIWPEYSLLHDSFAALLYYENSRKNPCFR